MARRRSPVLFAAVTVALMSLGLMAPGSASPPVAGAPAASSARGAIAPDAPTFGQPTISGIQGVGFEPDIRLDSRDRVYSSVPGSLSSTTSWVWRSLDHGKTFKWIPASEPYTGKLPSCVGGGDTELAVDSGDNLYFNDLTLANFSTARSMNQGRTLVPGDCQSVETTPNDRQWYATDGDPTNGGNLYLVYNIVAGGDPGCSSGVVPNNQLVIARSPLPGAPQTAGLKFAPSQFISGPCDEAIMGNVEVSPVTHKIFVVHDNDARDAILMGRCVAVDFTADPTGLQCEDLPVTSFPGYLTGASFPSMAIDTAGNLYAVWQQAPVDGTGDITGDVLLYWSSSTDEGNSWTTPVQIPTPGLHNNIMTWAAAGDAGRIDVVWYGTPATEDPSSSCDGPDAAFGDWSVYFTQTLNGTQAQPDFLPQPIVASEHFIHRGTMATIMDGLCGDRTLGDFLQLRVGNSGEANVIYGDSNNVNEPFSPHAMFVRQNGGTGVFVSDPVVDGAASPLNKVSDPAGDATYEYNSMEDNDQPNLDILGSSISQLDADTYRVEMTVSDLTSLAPDPSTGNPDTTLVWHTQWLTPHGPDDPTKSADDVGGRNFFVYMQSTGGLPPTFWVGENAAQLIGGGVTFTYPGRHQVPGSYTPTAPGTITIDVPISEVTVKNPLDNRLHEVTASTMTLAQPSQCGPSPCAGSIGGSLFNLIDPAPSYDFTPTLVLVTGHAHTDYNGDNHQGKGDVHLEPRISGDFQTGEASGSMIYKDLRRDPPGNPVRRFSCDVTPQSISVTPPATAVVQGSLTCRTFGAAQTFTLTITDNGVNPPNSDHYRMTIRNSNGNVVYDWADDTTVGLGDLVVAIG